MQTAAREEVADGTGSGLRIMHVTEAPLGGVLSHIEEVLACQSQDRRFASITILVPDINAPALEPFASGKVRVETITMDRGSLAGLFRLGRLTAALLRERRPDILHVHSTFAGVVSRLAARLTFPHVRIVYCPHGWAFSRETGALQGLAAKVVEWCLSWTTDAIVCVSQAEKDAAVSIGIRARRCRVIENGIRPTSLGRMSWESPPKGKLKVLFVGRFDRQKGFDIFLRVMDLLGDMAEGFAIGDYLVSSEARPVIPPNVTLLGWQSRERINRWYTEADLLLIPSRWEGLPIVAIEAMRAGLPVFSSRAGGLPDLVIDGVTGRLFDIKNPGAIADIILATPRKTLQLLGKGGLERFLKRFTADVMNRKIIDLYEEFVARDIRSS